jgi:hypothetical protein
MNLVEGMWLVMFGVLGIASYRLRNLKGASRFVLYVAQLFLGGRAVLLGLWATFSSLVLNTGWLRNAPVFWLTRAAVGVVELGLGLTLLAGMILAVAGSTKSDAAATKRRDQLAVAQAVLGGLAIAVSVWAGVFCVMSTL